MDALDTQSGQSFRSDLDPMNGRSSFVTIAVLAMVLINFYFFWAYANFIKSVVQDMPAFEQFDESSFENRQAVIAKTTGNFMHVGIAGFFLFASSVSAIVAVCLFFYRATSNLHKAGLSGLTTTPGMAVGWFFIPFVQLVMPLLVSIQMWKGSQAISQGSANWKKNAVSPWIYLWYVAFIGGILFYFIMSFQMQARIMQGALAYGSDLKPADLITSISSLIQITFYGYAGFKLLEGISLVMFTRKVAQLQTPV